MKTILIVLFFIGMFIYNVFKSSAAAKKKQSERVLSLGEDEQEELFENESKLVHNQGVSKNDFASRKAFDSTLEGVSSLELESRNRAGFFTQYSARMGSKDTDLGTVSGQKQGSKTEDSTRFEAFDREENHDFGSKRVFELRDAVVYSAILHRPQY